MTNKEKLANLKAADARKRRLKARWEGKIVNDQKPNPGFTFEKGGSEEFQRHLAAW